MMSTPKLYLTTDSGPAKNPKTLIVNSYIPQMYSTSTKYISIIGPHHSKQMKGSTIGVKHRCDTN